MITFGEPDAVGDIAVNKNGEYIGLIFPRIKTNGPCSAIINLQRTPYFDTIDLLKAYIKLRYA